MRNKKAFTIIELIVVVAILGVLVLLAGPKLLGYVEKAELTRIQHDVKVMEHEMKLALIDKEVEIAKWDNNKKNLGALIMQYKLFEKEGAAERIDARHLLGKEVSNVEQSDSNLGMGGDLIPVESENILSVDETYKIIPTEYKDVIGTRLSGMFYTNDLGKVYYEHDKPILGEKKGAKTLDCPLPLSDYDFDPETGTLVKWYGTETHLIIPEAFRAEVNGEEQCVPVKIIGEAAFMQGNFRSIVIPQSVIRIEENAFKDNQLTEVTIPHSVKYIGSGAFVGNSFGSGGSNIIIRNTYGNVEILPGAFGGYEPTYRSTSPKDLNMVFHPSSGTIISAGPSKSRVITIPETLSVGGIEYPVKQIGKGAYQGLGLISVVLPSGLERIEDYAFAGNQLIGITIPSKVNHIGNYAFAFNEVEHTITGHRKATIEFINIKNEELFHKVNQYGDIYENGTKVKNYKGQDGSEARLLNHIFVTNIENHVIDEKYVGANPGELEDNPEDKGDSDTSEEQTGLINPVKPREPNGEIPIYSADDLDKVRRNRGGKYILMNDIDLSVIDNWEPIGNANNPFRGQFDGNGYKINNLKVTRENINNVGLFGYTSRATITNVALLNVNVTGYGNVGGLVGRAYESTRITNSYATGSVHGNNYVGGLVGQAFNGEPSITNSYATGSVRGDDYVGGLMGHAWSSTITNSYATGNVTGTGDRVGGLVGTANYSTITNSYATGSVEGTGSDYVGGLVGYAGVSTITNSYTTGSVTGKGTYVGGLAGEAYGGAKITNSYATGSVTGTGDYVGGLVGRAVKSTVTNSYATGNVTGGRSNVGGLVGHVREGTEITNSYATGSVEGVGSVGGLVGRAYYSTITNSYATGSVEGVGSVGGLMGFAESSTIRNSYATGSVTGTKNVGGLVGAVYMLTVTNSYWDLETTEQISSRGGSGKNTNEMEKKGTYSGWDFDTIWDIDEGQSYPYLRNNPQSPLPGI